MQHARLADDPRRAVEAAVRGEAAGLLVATSGSSGAPRDVVVSREAMLASCEATRERLGGPGAWLLAIPAERIGGALVIARALLDGTQPATLPPGPLTAQALKEAAAALPAGRRFTSLVPTQVVRLARTAQGRDALAAFDGILVGGAALPPLEVDARLISTYGSTETCGGCVYDGVPLDGVRVATDAQGRVSIGGPTIADGYADGDNTGFSTDGEGIRWFAMPDAGAWDGSHLTIDGRTDFAIVTGGMKAHPSRIERALQSLPFVADAAVAGVPDHEWGERVAAWVVASGMVPSLGEVRAALAPQLAPHELPRELHQVRDLPRTPGGKIDRRAMRALARGEE